MIVYLTSHTGGYIKKEGVKIPSRLKEENCFLENLQKDWKENANVLIIGSDPDNFEKNDSVKNIYARSFPMSGLSAGRIALCDSRSAQKSYMRSRSWKGKAWIRNTEDFCQDWELRN